MTKTMLIGHLGNDATVNNVNGKNVINFSVAHSEKYKDSNGTIVNKSTWFACAYWSDKTGIVPYLKKGSEVYVEGIVSADTYINKDNKTLPQLRLRVSSIQLLGGSKQENNNRTSEQSFNEIVGNQSTDFSDNLPF
jgi:single-strand DNA-binding protein